MRVSRSHQARRGGPWWEYCHAAQAFEGKRTRARASFEKAVAGREESAQPARLPVGQQEETLVRAPLLHAEQARAVAQQWLLHQGQHGAARQLEALSPMALRELHRENGFLRLTLVSVLASYASRWNGALAAKNSGTAASSATSEKPITTGSETL